MNKKSSFAVRGILVICIVLFKLPPIDPFFSQSNVINTYLVAKLLLFICLFYFLAKKQHGHVASLPLRVWVLLGVFSWSTLSVANTINIPSFLRSYQNLFFGFLLYWLVRKYSDPAGQIERRGIIFLTFLLVGIDSVYAFIPHLTLDILKYLVPENMYEYFLFNLNRGRPHLDLNTEVFLPFLLLPQFKNMLHTSKKRATFFIGTLILFFVGVLSQFRRRLLIYIFVLGGFLGKSLPWGRIPKRNFIFGIMVAVIVVLCGFFYFQNENIYGRYYLSDENMQSIEYRYYSVQHSFTIALRYPFLGTGLGNYKYHLPLSLRTILSVKEDVVRFNNQTIENPHNVVAQYFAETGLVGGGTFLLFLFLCLLFDFSTLRRGSVDLRFALIVSFWAIVLYALFSPFDTLFKNAWFWFSRGLLDSELWDKRA